MTPPNAPTAAERAGEEPERSVKGALAYLRHHEISRHGDSGHRIGARLDDPVRGECTFLRCVRTLESALLAARRENEKDDERVVLSCKRCGFNAGNKAIFERHWQTNHAALAATETR